VLLSHPGIKGSIEIGKKYTLRKNFGRSVLVKTVNGALDAVLSNKRGCVFAHLHRHLEELRIDRKVDKKVLLYASSYFNTEEGPSPSYCHIIFGGPSLIHSAVAGWWLEIFFKQKRYHARIELLSPWANLTPSALNLMCLS